MAVKGVKDVMNKAKVMTATATLVAGLGVASHVNADEVDLSSTTQNPEAQTNQTENNVTKADVNAAKANLDNANQAVSNQEQVVNDAATVADEAQSAYNQAQQSTNEAQNLVDQATPENIASVQDDVNSAQKQVEQAKNTEKVAEDTAAQTQEAVNNQSEVVDSAQSDVSAAQSAVDAAQKDVNDKQAILDGTGQAEIIANRDKAQDDVNSAQNQVAQAESDLTKAQEADANRQQAIDNAQQAVDEANQTVTSTKSDLNAKTAQANQTQAIEDAKQADVATAQKDVNDKQAILDGTGQKAILDEAEAAKNDEASKQANLSAAKSALKQAQAADANRQIAIDKAQKAVNDANQTITLTKADLDAKTAKANQAQTDLAKAQEAFKTAETDYNSINTITLSQAYIDALKVYADGKATAEQKAKATEILKVESAKLAKENVFKANPNEPDYRWGTTEKTYDAENLPDDVVKDLSLFGSDLINQIRVAFGSPKTVVTSSSIKLAQLVRKGYQADNWNLINGHDIEALERAGKYLGIDRPAECATITSLKGQVTVGNLKREVYQSLVEFMFNDVEWNHAAIVACVGKNYASYMKVTYFGFENGVGTHFLFNSNASLKSNSNFDIVSLDNSHSSEKITTTYNTAKADLEAKVATNNSAQSALSVAQNSYNIALAVNTKAQQGLAESQSVAIQTPTAQVNLASAETALAKAQERLTKAQKAVDALNADIKAKQDALTSAKAVLEAAQSDLAKAQADNNVAQEVKNNAQTAYDNAVLNLSSASATLTQAQSVAIQMPTAKANLASAQATLKQAQENLVKAQKAVDDLSADIKVKQANLASVKQVLATKQAILATKQATLTTEQNRLASLQNSLATAQANVLKAKENVVTAKDNLTKAQTYLTRLQNAPILLAQDQQQEATAKANLLAALDTLEAELLKLKDLQVKQAAAQAVYDTTSKAYQTMLDAQEKQRLQDEYDAIIAQGKTPVAIVDETGKIVSYQAEDPQTTIQSSTVESTAVKAQVKPVEEVSVVTASALPMTGEHSSVLAVLFGCLMMIWGLVGVRKQKQ